MDKAKGIAKSGWHPPGKDGKKESWRGDFKGINQVAGWVGKGKDSHSPQAAQEHQSRPLATLKDPEAFGPPPKNVNYHGGAAVPNAITPDRRGLGAPLSAEEIHAQSVHEESEKRAQEEAAQKPPPPPVPYRLDTTGLSTGNLPKPPVRRIEAADPANPHSSPQAARPSTKPKPSLPPRLPPRDAATPTQDPPAYTSTVVGSQASSGLNLNHGALNRLGSAGVSVPGLNIGGQSEASQSEDVNRPAESTPAPKPTLGELHTKFSGLSTRPPASESASAEGTPLAQKQAALKTASSSRKDPTSVSLSDAKATAATANNFRERHGGQVASSFQTANALNQRYNVAGQLSHDTNNIPVKEGVPHSSSANNSSHSPPFNIKKKPPPPPPPKRGMGSDIESTGPPPPVPLSSRPRP